MRLLLSRRAPRRDITVTAATTPPPPPDAAGPPPGYGTYGGAPPGAQYGAPPPGYGAPQPGATVIYQTQQQGYVGFGRAPANCVCPNCHANIMTTVDVSPGPTAWICCLVLGVLGVWPCCLIPFCTFDRAPRAHRTRSTTLTYPITPNLIARSTTLNQQALTTARA